MSLSIRRRFAFGALAILLCVTMSACGYHLAGRGRGAVPPDVKTVWVSGTGDATKAVLPLLRDYVSGHAKGYTVTTDRSAADATLRLGDMSETFTPSAYDAQGVATTYEMTVTGSLNLLRKGKPVWASGTIRVQGTVYAVGGPVSIEASRARMRRDLQRQWVREAWLRLASGF